jgi:hypothetical protein
MCVPPAGPPALPPVVQLCGLNITGCLLFTVLQDNASARNFFDDWQANYEVPILPDANDYSLRLDIFTKNLETILKWNVLDAAFWLAPNRFSHLTAEEFARAYLGLGSSQVQIAGSGSDTFQANAPERMDWVERGKVTPIKDQGNVSSFANDADTPCEGMQLDCTAAANSHPHLSFFNYMQACGSCWAYAASAALESKLMISTGQDRDLSEQQLVDCVTADRGFNSLGCDGGWPHDAFNYVQQTGLASEAAYPYTARTGQCNLAAVSSSPDLARISTSPGYVKLPANSATALMKVGVALRCRCLPMQHGPCFPMQWVAA